MTNKIKKRSLSLGIMITMVFLIQTGLSFGEIRLAVAPFQVELGHEKEIVRCSSCGNIMGGGIIEGDPAPLLTRILWDFLQNKEKGFDLINPGQVEGVYNIDLAKGIEKDHLTLMGTMGNQLKADYILWGALFHYEERIGTSYGVKQPASVAFDLHLLRVKDGTLVWRAQWSKTQKSLTENLFEIDTFLKQKSRWATAEELFRQGMEEIFKNFPTAESLH